ncbi:Alpha/Beta hydrolase protein, partial [Plectosphaerella plurivora]
MASTDAHPLLMRLRAKLPWHKTSHDSQILTTAPETGHDYSPPNPPGATNRPRPLAVPSFPDGVKVLHDCRDATVDVCFVHGLTGNRDGTWTAHGQSKPWPETLLPAALSDVRILTYGYDAYILQKSVASTNRLIDHATNLVNDLTTDRARCDASNRPLIFVAHSLGGFVCKEAILLSRNNPEPHLRGIFNCIKGVAFMGTPHRGSWMADWAKIPASALGIAKSTNTSLLKILGTDDEFLQSVQGRFWSMVREQQKAGQELDITCFFEELPLPVVGTVVPKDSATLEGYNAISIHANHGDMVRFGSPEDSGFKRLLGELVRWRSQIRSTTATQPTRLIEEAHVEKSAKSSFHNYGPGNQFNAPGGTQNISNGSGAQFPGATFSGPVQFG